MLGDDLQISNFPEDNPEIFNKNNYNIVYNETYYTIDYRAKDCKAL